MKKLMMICAILLVGQSGLLAQEEKKENARVEYLKEIDISEKEQNEYTGRYQIKGEKKFFIEVTLNDGNMSIVIPDIEKSEGESLLTQQLSMAAQYKDKFYLRSEAFVKIHFTRSKKSKKVISLLFNPSRVKGFDTIRATKVD